MKKMVIVTYSENVAEFYSRQIKNVFDDYIEIETLFLEGKSIDKKIVADLVLISSPYILKRVIDFIDEDCEILHPNLTFSNKGQEVLASIPKGTKAFVVNASEDLTLGTVSLIYQMGYRDLDLVPFSPGIEVDRDIRIAITPNQEEFVPNHVETVYNVDDRIIDVTTLVDIATVLGVDEYLDKIGKLALNHQVDSTSMGFENIMLKSMRMEGQLEVLFSYMTEGIIGINNHKQISFMNKSASKYLDVSKEEAIGEHYKKIWNNLLFEGVFEKRKPIINKVVKREGTTYVVNLYPIINNRIVSGALCIFNSYVESEKTQHKIRKQIVGKGHKAVYNFDDVAGNSDLINRIKQKARNIAKSDASVLLYGESGTGKELIAQSIHNESNRKNGFFVAINCAALPEQLLESELFGYVEGAFTGAKKGGKQGLFEIAHNGTLFLDEIGEMPLRLQSRLLRVIQERKVMPLGGEYLIDIDVRIIAATNKDLKQMTRDNAFRKDLYYRLNVLYLKIPPLRERNEDIPIIIESMLNKMGRKLHINENVLNVLKGYQWEGNVRELNNCIEYFCHLDTERIGIPDLPDYISDEIELNSSSQIRTKTEGHNRLDDREFEILILKKLYEAYNDKKRIGRRRIYEYLLEEGYIISENGIRKYVHNLESMGLVRILNGRAGTIITNHGIEYLIGLMGLR